MLLASHPDLAGIYNIDGGAAGVARASVETRRQASVVFVGHGLTPDTRALLIDGTMDAVITQNPHRAVQDCLAVFDNVRAGRDALDGIGTARSEILFRENLPG